MAVLTAINLASWFAKCPNQDPTWLVGLSQPPSLIDCFLNQSSAGAGPALTTISLCLDRWLWRTNPSGYLMTSLSITLACSFLTALICLEWTGRYGNRLKAIPAIWSALLFNLYPPVAHLTASPAAAREYELNFLFLLMVVFALTRWDLLRERPYIFLAGFGVVLLAANGFLGEFALPQHGLPAALSEGLSSLLFPEQLVAKEPGLRTAAGFSYWLLVGLAFVRMLLARKRPKYLLLCLAWIIAAICLIKPDENQATISPALFYAAAPFALALSLLAFPSADQLKLSHNRAAALIGLIALLVLVLSFATGAK